MNVQTNNFQGIYGKMALAQKGGTKRYEMLSRKTSISSDNEYSSVKARNTLSPYHAFESMKNASAKFMTNNLMVQAKQPVQTVDNKRYLIEKSDEIEGCWRIYDKKLDKSFVFDPSSATVQVDKNTGKYYLVADAPTGGLMDVIPADAALMSTLAQFLNVESADSILTSTLNDNYTITIDAFTGIECLKIKGNEGNGSWLMISNEQQKEKLQELANVYKEKYPHLAKSDGVAMGFAIAEVAGGAVRTENGILMISCSGMEYMDDADPSKSWAILYSINDTNMYSEIMNAMSEGYIAGKDIEDYAEWEKYFKEKRLAFEKVMTDEELAAIAKEYDAKTIAAKEYAKYQSENYRIVPDKEAKCFDIYNSQGERLGVFNYADIKIRRDSATGKQFLISEHGTMSYDALVLDHELKEDLQKVMGVDALETEELQGFTLKKHSGTGIRYLVRDGEEGRGGKVLLESAADQKKYEALAETYLNRYPNLIESKEEAYIWADLEIKGLAQHTKDGIISTGFNGMSYNDNANSKNNWSVLFSEGTYQAVFEWLQNNKESIQEMQKFASWQDVFESIGSGYERIWSKEEEKQGYLNN